ncbi:MAG: phospholipase D-like domain-containing protein, partial [Planctomycetaceae bacterium]|nr:phospholipase D-like domain-containing protein [Planctomycetaceae bacterium]
LSMYYAAKKNIYIQTPYLAPDESVLDALRIAARSNVDVRLMIPRVSDYAIVHLATLGYARDLQALGVKIYMYNGFIHSKTSVIDGTVATIGTTNITNRSFTLDFEVNAFVYDNDFAERCEAIFNTDEKTSFLLPENYFAKQNILRRASYNFARMLAPMM